MTEFTHTVTGSKGVIEARLDGHTEPAEMTYSIASETLVIVDHTGVPDSMRGLGVGNALAEEMLRLAREKGFKIVPLCPFMRAYSMRHRADVEDVVNL